MIKNPQKTILVIFGITGDLAKRKLLPALSSIAKEDLPFPERVIGISRREVSIDDVLGNNADEAIRQALTPFTMNVSHAEDYSRLHETIRQAKEQMGESDTQVVFYLSVPPHASLPIVEFLGQAGINDDSVKILLEKPFGVDLPSAQEIIDKVSAYYHENQLYRIDHYLAKEMVQSVIAFRSKNAIFRHLWHKNFIERIDIIASEKIGIEGRTNFYEQTGALRDFLQNHLMQLMALTIMEIPPGDEKLDIPAQRLKALQSIQPVDMSKFEQLVTRGQYDGYQEEVGNPGSLTETFVSMTLFSGLEYLQGVPIHLATGKNLAKRTVEIRVRFKKASADESDDLIFHVQPKESIEIELWAKKAGYEKHYEKVELGFNYRQGGTPEVEAYERVLLDAFYSDKSLFTTSSEILESWRILQPVQERWAMQTDDLTQYAPGTDIYTLVNVPKDLE